MNLTGKTKEELISEIEALRKSLKEQQDFFQKTVTPEYKNSVIRWNSFFLFSPHQILILDKEGTILSTNFIPGNSAPPEAIIGKCAYDFISPEFKDKYIAAINEVISAKKSTAIDLHGKGPGDSFRWYHSYLYPIAEGEEASSVIVVITDVTDRKQIELKVIEQQEKLDAFAEASNEGILVHEDGIIKESNTTAEKILGYSGGELIGKNLFDFLDEPVIESIRTASKKSLPIHVSEHRIKRKNGEIIYCEHSGHTISYNNRKVRIAAIKDITQSKISREKLVALEERYRKLSEAPFEAILIHENGPILEVNEALINMFGYSREELLGMKGWDLAIPEQRPNLIERVKNRVTQAGEYTGLRKNGTTFFAELQTKETNHNGKYFRVVAIRDITERKNYETRLHQSKEDYESLVKYSPDGIFIHNMKGNIVFVNPSAMKIAGIRNLKQVLNKSIYDFILPEFHGAVKSRGELLKKGKDVPFSRIKISKITGGSVPVEYKPVMIRYKGEDSILVVYHDIHVQEKLALEQTRAQVAERTNILLKKEIDQRKAFEKQLKSNEEKYKDQSVKLNTIIESSSHMFWTTNKKMELLSFNRNFEKLMSQVYGVKPKTGTNLSNGSFVSTPETNKFWKERSKEAFMGKNQYFETSIRSKKGYLTWLEVYLNPIQNEQGRVVEVSGIAHDITDKKQTEEKIKTSLQEKEVLLKEIHHRVKNNLQVISSILNLQSTYVKDEKTLDILKESQNRIKSMSFIHESLYRNKDFSNINFKEYIRNLASNLLVSYSGLSKKISLKQKIDDVFLNLDIAIPLGLIINELMSNALKYAFLKKDHGKIEISVEAAGKEALKVIVSDNGSGVPSNINFRKTESLGLQLVNILTDQLRGTIKLDNTKGAKFTLTFNKQSLNK